MNDNSSTLIIGYKKLIAWQVADKFVKAVYKSTFTFPREEMFGVTSQLRRSSLSVVLNIVEGYARNNRNEFRQFLKISLGSLAESEYLIEFAKEQDYLKEEVCNNLIRQKEECGRIIWKLYVSQT